MTTPPPGEPSPGPTEEPRPSTDAPYNPFLFGLPEPGSPAAAAFPEVMPPTPPAAPGPGAGPGYGPPAYGPPAYGPPPGGWTPPPTSIYQQQPGYPPGQQYPGYGPPPGYYPGYGTPAAQQGNGKAIAGFVLGLASVPLCFLTLLDYVIIVAAVIFSLIGLRTARGGAPNKGLAVAGLILAGVGTIAATVLLVVLTARINDCSSRYQHGTAQYTHCVIPFSPDPGP